MVTEIQTQGLGEFARRAFTLEHPDDHVVLLMHDGQRVATFSQTGATEESIQAECSSHLVMKHGWDGCLWKGGKDVV
jgi:hypothetical protein